MGNGKSLQHRRWARLQDRAKRDFFWEISPFLKGNYLKKCVQITLSGSNDLADSQSISERQISIYQIISEHQISLLPAPFQNIGLRQLHAITGISIYRTHILERQISIYWDHILEHQISIYRDHILEQQISITGITF